MKQTGIRLKQTAIRYLAILLALWMLVVSFMACSGKGSDQETGTTGSTVESEDLPDNSGEESVLLHPKKQDFGGYTYRMVFDGGLSTQWWGPLDDLTSDALDLAFFRRNEFLKDYLNIEIMMVSLGASQYQMADHLATMASVGEDFADAMFAVAAHIMPSAVANGYALELSNMEGLNPEASYWDQRIQQEYAVQGYLFALEGDFTIYDELRTHVVLYNGKLYGDYGYTSDYGSPYTMVRDGKWTMDTMLEMIEGRSDLDNGPLTASSQWGMLSETPFPYIVFLGTGKKTIQVQEDGSLSLLFADPTYYSTAYSMFENIMNKVGLNQEVLFADASRGVLTGDIWVEVSNMFESNQALFRTTTLSAATRLYNMQASFGILPIPKYEESQETYYSWCSADAHSPLMIPSTALSHCDTTAAITEAMCYFSKYMDSDEQTVLEAFYENMAVAKLCRSEEDYAMLQLIFANKTYDIDLALGITGIRHVLTGLIGKQDITTLSSEFKSRQENSSKALSEFLSDMMKNMKN